MTDQDLPSLVQELEQSPFVTDEAPEQSDQMREAEEIGGDKEEGNEGEGENEKEADSKNELNDSGVEIPDPQKFREVIEAIH